ncbi:hypothetical protein PFISCL1PPCAC_10569 [Pristionchus fissidentatus]|uniref:G protein-coupled receptor n=1 Tax=Pristionchus fissidentatus TaxID=1538716 RepID=A0AAV5VMK5_9BILA|nr:hypothetical protein PFISCL1PPCAC_10569 [Pristionchus fissidentatus]
MVSRILSIISIISSLGLLLPLTLNRPIVQSLIVASFLLLNAISSCFVFPAIEKKNHLLMIPQLVSSTVTQVLALSLIFCAVMEIDGETTILSYYKPYDDWWNGVGADFTLGVLIIWTIVFILGNFVLFVHFRTFISIRRSGRPSSTVLSSLPPPYSLFTLQVNGRPEGSPPSYDDIYGKEYTVNDLPR